MRKNHFLHVLNTLIFLSLGCISTHSLAAPAFAQLSSNRDQVPDGDNTAVGTVIVLQNQDALAGMGWDPKTNQLTIKEDGVYFLSMTAEVGIDPAVTRFAKAGNVYIWYELNKKPIPNSGNWIEATPNERAQHIHDQMVLPLKAGDVLVLKYKSNAQSVGLVTSTGNDPIPDSPGLTFSIFKTDSTSVVNNASTKK